MNSHWTDDELERLFMSEILPPDLADKIDHSAEARRELGQIMRMAGAAAVMAATPQVEMGRLAASSATHFAPPEIGSEAGVHAIFVDPDTLEGCVRGLIVKLVPAARFGAVRHPSVRCDGIMAAAAERGVQAAVEALDSLGFPPPEPGQAIEWRIGNDDDPPVIYSGASIGLAVAVASAALLCGERIAFDVAVSGAVDEAGVLPVRGIAEKYRAVAARNHFSQLLIPTACLADLPADARQARRPRVLPVSSVRDAINVLLGVELGVGAQRLAADTEAGPSPSSIYLRLWGDDARVQTRGQSVATRSISGSTEPAESWRIGDRIRFGFWASGDCHVLLLNRGSSGKIHCLLPSEDQRDTRLAARQEKYFPGFDLRGPAGTENLIALATRRPVYEELRDFLASVHDGTATMPDVLKVMSGPQVLGTATVRLEVESAAERGAARSVARTRGCDVPSVRWLAFDC